jgi:signal transduction histidine kinase
VGLSRVEEPQRLRRECLLNHHDHGASLTAIANDGRRERELEERRRLRRDLHDGLGPQLASLTLRLETARDRLAHEPLATELLSDLIVRTQDAVADIRRLVYGLRPPALDDLGLISALRESTAGYGYQGHDHVRIDVDAPEALPPLPAAVEVAVYRIVQEAVTNVARHANALHCVVRLTLDEDAQRLSVEVIDDGRGLAPNHRPGVGMTSMYERAEELGGSLTITVIPPGGTCVHATLPCTMFPDPERGDRT